VKTLETEKAQEEFFYEKKLSEIRKDLASSHEKFTAAQVIVMYLYVYLNMLIILLSGFKIWLLCNF